MAEFTNVTTEILLPRTASHLRDGALVGQVDFASLAPGDTAELGFGAIEGLRLTRDMPLRTEGDRGFVSTSNQIEESAVLKVENLTDETWPVRVLDQVPYSEPEDLSITHSADLAPTETDVDGQRGILAWDFDLAPGAVQDIKPKRFRFCQNRSPRPCAAVGVCPIYQQLECGETLACRLAASSNRVGRSPTGGPLIRPSDPCRRVNAGKPFCVKSAKRPKACAGA